MSATLGSTPVKRSLTNNQDRVYKNEGNIALIALLDSDVRQVLDVGCGAGDNAELVHSRFPGCQVHGITHSAAEAELAKLRMMSCSVWDIEGDIPSDFNALRFDTIIFSHVLEHMRDPELVLQKFSRLLKNAGTVLIAVPNALSWSMRWQFLRGDFEYRSDGVLDDTHLRFFTYLTADRYLLGKCPEFKLTSKGVTGSVPLWWFRRYLLPKKGSEFIDWLGCRLWPNLFGGQILLKAVYDQSNRRI
jgi:2-polyprenyl-3-methyl-5-hydroxy-6-metoxy-1,4-benzoquinol methylase